MAKTAAKKAAPKKAVKKVAATKTAKPAKAAAAKSAAPKPIKEALSKTGLVAHIAESTQLAPRTCAPCWRRWKPRHTPR